MKTYQKLKSYFISQNESKADTTTTTTNILNNILGVPSK